MNTVVFLSLKLYFHIAFHCSVLKIVVGHSTHLQWQIQLCIASKCWSSNANELSRHQRVRQLMVITIDEKEVGWWTKEKHYHKAIITTTKKPERSVFLKRSLYFTFNVIISAPNIWLTLRNKSLLVMLWLPD